MSKLFKKSGCCIFEGDFIGSNENQEIIKLEVMKNIKKINNSIYKYSSQYTLVYINNITDNKLNIIINELKSNEAFTGYFDFTYSSLLKEYISNIIGQNYIIYKNNIITSSCEYSFKEYDFKKIYISEINYIFNLEYIDQYNTVKFNTIIENIKIPFKLLISLKYLPEIKELQLITMC